MRKYFNRRGVSAVVANVLIILLVVVGVALIWAAVRPSIEEGAEGVQADCFTLQVLPESCTISGTTANVRLKRNPGSGALNGVSFQFSNTTTGTNGVARVNTITATDLQELNSKLYPVPIPTTVISPNTVNVAIHVGPSQKLCDITSSPVACA